MWSDFLAQNAFLSSSWCSTHCFTSGVSILSASGMKSWRDFTPWDRSYSNAWTRHSNVSKSRTSTASLVVPFSNSNQRSMMDLEKVGFIACARQARNITARRSRRYFSSDWEIRLCYLGLHWAFFSYSYQFRQKGWCPQQWLHQRHATKPYRHIWRHRNQNAPWTVSVRCSNKMSLNLLWTLNTLLPCDTDGKRRSLGHRLHASPTQLASPF